jgi:hypothetical protein
MSDKTKGQIGNDDVDEHSFDRLQMFEMIAQGVRWFFQMTEKKTRTGSKQRPCERIVAGGAFPFSIVTQTNFVKKTGR